MEDYVTSRIFVANTYINPNKMNSIQACYSVTIDLVMFKLQKRKGVEIRE